jgi:hypothetical protein
MEQWPETEELKSLQNHVHTCRAMLSAIADNRLNRPAHHAKMKRWQTTYTGQHQEVDRHVQFMCLPAQQVTYKDVVSMQHAVLARVLPSDQRIFSHAARQCNFQAQEYG